MVFKDSFVVIFYRSVEVFLFLSVDFWLYRRFCSSLVPSSVSVAKCGIFSGIFFVLEGGGEWFYKASNF